MEEQIEIHFNKCVNALAARKDKLLRDLAEMANTQRKMAEEASAVVQQTVLAQRGLLTAGETVFNLDSNHAEYVWKGILNMNPPQFFFGNITLDLPDSLDKSIQDYGKVLLSNSTKNPKIAVDYSKPKEAVPFAGSTKGFDNGQGPRAQFNNPCGMCWSSVHKCLFVCDSQNNAIRKVSEQGVVSTFACGGYLKSPHGIAIHRKSNDIFITNQGSHNILKISCGSGITTVVAGSGRDGCADGAGVAASFSSPNGIAIDQKTGNLFVSDYGNNLIRKITPQGIVSTLAGSKDGRGTIPQFFRPWGIWFCKHNQSLLVCDYSNNRLQRVVLTGEVTTICTIQGPSFVAATRNSILVSSSSQKKIFLVQEGQVTEIKVKLNWPNGIALQGSSCYVTEYADHKIIQINY